MRSVSMTIPAALVAQVRDGLLEVERVRRDSLAHASGSQGGESGARGDEAGGGAGAGEQRADQVEAISALAAQLGEATGDEPVELTADPALVRAAAADALLTSAAAVETDARAYLESESSEDGGGSADTGESGGAVRRRAGELVALVDLLNEIPSAG